MTEETFAGDFSPIEGKEGWLFLNRFENLDVMAFYTDEAVIGDAVMTSWARTMEHRHRWFAERKIPFITLVVPEACTVYPDMLPDGIQLSSASPYERLHKKLSPETAAEVVYPRQILVNGRSRYETFQKVDSHWTDWGAYLGYRAAMERVRKLVPGVRIIRNDEITWNQRRTFGALGPLMTPEQSCLVPVPTIATSTSVRTVENIANERRDGILTVEGDSRLPTLLIFRDSFTTAMAPFLQLSFGRTIYATAHAVHYDLVEQLKPDVVIYERGERALYWPPEEPSFSDARGLFGDLRLGTEAAMVAQRSSRTLLGAGKPAEALAMSDSALELASPDAVGRGRAYIHRANIYGALGDAQTALECLQLAMTLEPDAALPVMKAGEVERSLGRLPEAIALHKRAVALEPSVPHYWDMLVSAQLEQNDNVGAKESLQRLVALDDSRMQTHLLLARTQNLEGDLQSARTKALEGFETEPHSVHEFANIASMLIQQSQWIVARDTLQRALKQFPEATDFLPYLQLCEARIQEQEAAA